MALSNREKLIAFGVGAAVVLYLLDSSVVEPYFDRLKTIQTQTDDANSQLTERDGLFTRRNDLKKVWASMTRTGLQPDLSVADSQVAQALLKWANDAQVAVTNVKPDRATEENGFQVLGYHLTCTGNTPQVTKLIWDVETATIPVRLTDVQVTPRKDGTDDLTIQFGISTICQPQNGTGKPSTSGGGDGTLTTAGGATTATTDTDGGTAS